MRRTVPFLLVMCLSTAALTACQRATVGTRCTPSQSPAHDATHVLTCVRGRWRAAISLADAARIVAAAPGYPMTIAPISGMTQRIEAGTSFEPFVVEVTDAQGRPVPGALVGTVDQMGHGLLDVPSARTGADGRAHLVLPVQTRQDSGHVALGLLGGIDPRLDVEAWVDWDVHGAAPSDIYYYLFEAQSAPVGTEFSLFSLFVKDRFDNYLTDPQVEWTITPGPQGASGEIVWRNNIDYHVSTGGQAVRVKANNTPGTFTLTASVPGLPPRSVTLTNT